MLTLNRCRQLLGRNCTLSDSEVESLRDALYAVADIAVTTLVEKIYLLLFSPFDLLAIEESVTIAIVEA